MCVILAIQVFVFLPIPSSSGLSIPQPPFEAPILEGSESLPPNVGGKLMVPSEALTPRFVLCISYSAHYSYFL